MIDRLHWIEHRLAPIVRDALRAGDGIDLRGITAQAIQMGDECQNRNKAGTSLLFRELAPRMVEVDAPQDRIVAAMRFIAGNDHFYLNLAMPAAKVAADAAHGVARSTLVTAMARNRTDFGIRVSGHGDRWFTGAAQMIDGPFFPGFGPDDANPDIGDSAITETVGIGGFALAGAPAIVQFIGGAPADAVRYTRDMYDITAAENELFRIPALNCRGTPTGIDVRKVIRIGELPVIDTGMAHREAGVGQVGAVIVRPPMACFVDAWRATERRTVGANAWSRRAATAPPADAAARFRPGSAPRAVVSAGRILATDECSALTISACAARLLAGPPRAAVVHSVFRRAANLRIPPGALLAITDAAAMRVPNGIVVAGSDDAERDAFLGPAAGMRAWIWVDTGDAPRWDPRPRFAPPPVDPAPFDRNLGRLARLVGKSAAAKPSSFAAVLGLARWPHEGVGESGHAHQARRARPAVAALIAALTAPEPRLLAHATEQVAGLGYGLTPSGDDFAIGVCGALLLADAVLPSGLPSPTPGVSRPEQAAVIATAAARRTTDLSAAWLRHAGRGEFSAEVGRVLVVLGNEDAAEFDEAADRLLAVGGLSGLDTAAGVLLGARAVLPVRPGRAAG